MCPPQSGHFVAPRLLARCVTTELCEPLSISTPHSIRIDKILNLKMREPLSITPSLHQETNKLKLESTKIEPEHVKLPSFASRNQSNKAVYLILSRIHPPKIVHPNSKQFNFHCQRPKKLQSKTPNPRTATMP